VKASNMRELTDEELRQKVSSYKEELFNWFFGNYPFKGWKTYARNLAGNLLC
jgi:hypothetical protein